MIYNMEKIDRVISKIVTDLGLGQNDIPFGDFVEWMADALQHIGAYPQFIEKSGLVMITDYTGVLPCDVYKVIQMNKSMSVDCDSSTTGGLYSDTLINLLNDGGVDYESLDGYQRYKIIAVPGLSKVSDINTIDGLSNKLNYNGNLIGKVTDHRHTSNDFNINFNKITTGFKNGFIEIQYLSFPTDERGWPLVPDDVSFRDALFWKVAYQMSMRNPELLRNPRMKDMEYCRQQWNRCCVQARAGANMPDLAQLERFKNQWLKLIPETNLDLTSYSSLGRAQSLNLDGRK
jgi:hypothetical protein